MAGNSEPVESESETSDAILVSFGGIEIWMRDTSSFTCANVSVVVSVNNSMDLAADGLLIRFRYDPTVLEPVLMKPTGLTDSLVFGATVDEGVWSLVATGGTISVGSGQFLELVFRVKDVYGINKTTVVLYDATIHTLGGQIVSINLPQSAEISIVAEQSKYFAGDIDGDGQLTQNDLRLLGLYYTYLQFPSLPHYRPYALTGEAAKAADVNNDGRVDANDIALLTAWLEELSGGAQ